LVVERERKLVIVFCGANSIYIDVGEEWKF
jgi:hypothetical protein